MTVPHELKQELERLPDHFYGSVEVTFQDGAPVIVKTTATRNIQRERDNRIGYSR
jgi:hypothetical protein